MGRNYTPRVEREELFRLYVHEQRSMREIGEILHASPTTVLDWMRKYDIPRRPSWVPIKLKTIDGVDHRTCSGPSGPPKDSSRTGWVTAAPGWLLL